MSLPSHIPVVVLASDLPQASESARSTLEASSQPRVPPPGTSPRASTLLAVNGVESQISSALSSPSGSFAGVAGLPSTRRRRKTSEELFIEELIGAVSSLGVTNEASTVPAAFTGSATGEHDAIAAARHSFRERLQSLEIVQYGRWGTTECTPWPTQNGKVIQLDATAGQVLQNTTSARVTRHEALLLSIFSKSERMSRFMCDAFWYMFLEHFALLDSVRRRQVYIREVKEDIRKQQEASMLPAIAKREFNHQTAEASTAVKASRRRLPRQIEGRLKRGHVRTGTSELHGEHPPQLHSPPDLKEALLRRFKISAEAPLHVISGSEAMKLRVPVMKAGKQRWQTEASRPRSTSANSDGARSSCSAHSHAASVISMPETVLAFDQEDAEFLETAGRQRVHSRTYLGDIELPGVIALLIAAEELDHGEIERARCSELGTEGSAELWKARAMVLIRREQDRMFSRMAKEYSELFRGLSRVQKDAALPSLPDVAAHIICQALATTVPYARDCLSHTTRKRIKCRLSYWMHGVEDVKVEQWKDSMPANFERSEEKVVGQPSSEFLSLKKFQRKHAERCLQDTSKSRTPRPPEHAKRISALERKVSSGAIRLPERKQSGAQLELSLRPPVSVSGDSSARYQAAFVQGMMEMRQAFEIVRAGTQALPASARGAELTDSHVGPHSSAASARLRQDLKRQQERHVLYHRFAPLNKRADLWHEQGRKPSGAVLPHASKSLFCLKSVSPLVRRHMEDLGVASGLEIGPQELLTWSL